MSESEISKILSSIEQDTLTGYRNTAVVLLFLDTGLRCAELVGLRMDDLFLADQYLKVMGKSRKERIVPFTENALKMVFERLARKAGIPRLHVHLLRHTMTTNYLLSGENPIKLQRIPLCWHVSCRLLLGNTIFEATIPFSVTLIMSQFER